MRNFLLLSTAFFLISCDDSGGGETTINPPAGTYHSTCMVTGASTSVVISNVISSDFRTVTSTELSYSTADCTGASASSSPITDVNENLLFSNKDLGGGVSYYSDRDNFGNNEYTPFLYANPRIYLGSSVSDISNGAINVFADFIANPTGSLAISIITLQ